jgi:hypothetical protein
MERLYLLDHTLTLHTQCMRDVTLRLIMTIKPSFHPRNRSTTRLCTPWSDPSVTNQHVGVVWILKYSRSGLYKIGTDNDTITGPVVRLYSWKEWNTRNEVDGRFVDFVDTSLDVPLSSFHVHSSSTSFRNRTFCSLLGYVSVDVPDLRLEL